MSLTICIPFERAANVEAVVALDIVRVPACRMGIDGPALLILVESGRRGEGAGKREGDEVIDGKVVERFRPAVGEAKPARANSAD